MNRPAIEDDLDAVRAGTTQLKGSKTHDFASVASGAKADTTVTVTGAALGDFVTSVALSVAVPGGCILEGNVTAADTVTVTLFNISGSPVDLASATLAVRVAQAATAL